MSKKIVAIGGRKNGRINNEGIKSPYETKKIDTEIINITGREHPNFLFIGHSQNEITNEESYFNVMKSIYGGLLGCECETIKKSDLRTDITKAEHLADWADIIYEGGGNTKGMLELWFETGFDKILRNAWNNGKVMCGVSAGANCWFKTCSSDSLRLQLNDNTAPMINVDGLNFVNAFFTPHCDVVDENTNRLKHMKESLQNSDLVGLGMSNCCALEIIDDKYRLIIEDASNYGIESYGIKTYWDNGQYIEQYIDKSKEFKNLDSLLSKST